MDRSLLEESAEYPAQKKPRKSELAKVSGKWSRREELIAEQLIVKFINGSLSDCEQGCTLRAYLSKKLECAPMRISKKFSGQNLGKVLMLHRTPSVELKYHVISYILCLLFQSM